MSVQNELLFEKSVERNTKVFIKIHPWPSLIIEFNY